MTANTRSPLARSGPFTPTAIPPMSAGDGPRYPAISRTGVAVFCADDWGHNRRAKLALRGCAAQRSPARGAQILDGMFGPDLVGLRLLQYEQRLLETSATCSNRHWFGTTS